jgi:SAM-dependent methyltransferase
LREGPGGDPAGGFVDHFSDRAADYARHRPGYPAELVDFLASSVRGRDLAWDAGAGSGQLSLLLAERFARVLATDASAEQLAAAPSHPGIVYRRALAGDSGLPRGSADLAVAAQAAHWFELGPYYAEVTRVARPGAVFALVTYAAPRVDGPAGRVVGRFHREVLAGHWPPERRHVEEGYRLLPFPFREVSAPELEMLAQWDLPRVLGYLSTWSAVRALERAEGPKPFEALERELARAWGDPDEARPVRWPLSLRVGIV